VQPLWLIGMMGSGKSTVGSLVAERLGWVHVDLDAEIARRVGCSIGELWGSAGEEAVRDLESLQVARFSDARDTVISTGGGVILRGENVRAMRNSGAVVWLDAPVDVLASRLAGHDDRPLLRGADPSDRLAGLAGDRAARYRGAAHHRVDSSPSAETVAARVLGHARVTVADESEVLIGADLPLDVLPERPERERVAILTQPGARRSADRAAELIGGLEVAVIVLPDREEAKTIETIGSVYEQLARLNLGRHDTILGVGGGTVTDAAGFVAATWLRGIESVTIPTTLLAAVDAAIGGKTGINVGGKNLVGAFWHAKRVDVSLDVLASAPRPLTIEGTAEAVKAGFISDEQILAAYERDGLDAPLGVVVPRSIQFKAEVVAGDFREHGDRAILNFGHTIGHGVEIVGEIPHGHAVSIGMVAAAAVSEARYGFDAQRLAGLLERLELPVVAPDVDRDAVLDLVARDKKRTGAGIRMVLLEDYGRPIVDVVSNDELELGLAAIGVN